MQCHFYSRFGQISGCDCVTFERRHAGHAIFHSVSKSVFSFFFCPSHKLVTEGVKGTGSDLGHMSKMGQEILLICDLSLLVLWLKNLNIIYSAQQN